MVDNLTDKMYHEWNLTNSDANNVNNSVSSNYLLQTRSPSRKLSDHNDNYSSNNSQHHHTHQHKQSTHSPPMITTTDYSDRSSLTAMSVSHDLFTRKSLDAGYDTDGGIGTSVSTSKSHRNNSNGFEHFLSPRLPTKRSVIQSSRQSPVVPNQQHSTQQAHLAVSLQNSVRRNHDNRDEEPLYEGDARRRHIRLSRRIPQRPVSTKTHGTHLNHPTTISRHEAALGTTSSGRPFRLIFMRHSERVNQILGPDWYSKAFRTGSYQSYDQRLPMSLPKRRSNEAYEFDAPLTAYGLKNARHTGRAMLSNNLAADVCLSSNALRCIQTAQRILTGMDRSDRLPIRVEPGLFECPHLNHKIVDSFMTKTELMENGYKIKHEYKPLIQKVNVPESLDEYFDRCITVMRGIIDRYSHHGGTVLIVTHAPGLLALTDAINGRRPHHDTFYRTVAKYPPLAVYIAEYDGTKWINSEQPVTITPLEQ